MPESDEIKCLFRFTGSFDEFVEVLHDFMPMLEFNGLPFMIELVWVGLTPTFGVWLQDPTGQNPYSFFQEDGLPYEAVCGLGLTLKKGIYDILLAAHAVNINRDKYGQATPPMTKFTHNTQDRELKEKRFIEALELSVKDTGKWQPPAA